MKLRNSCRNKEKDKYFRQCRVPDKLLPKDERSCTSWREVSWTKMHPKIYPNIIDISNENINDFTYLSLDDSEIDCINPDVSFQQDSDDQLSILSHSTENDYQDSFDSISLSSLNSFKTAHSPSEYSYHSSILRKVKRRKREVPYLQDNSFAENQDKGLPKFQDHLHQIDIDTSNSKESQSSVSRFQRVLSLLLLTIIFVTIFCVLCVFNFSRCSDQECKISSALGNLQKSLSNCVIGQMHIEPLIINTISSFFNAQAQEHVKFMWFVGPIGVGKSYTKQIIIKNLASNVNIHDIPSELLNSGDLIKVRMADLIRKVDVCKHSIVFIDSLDREEIELDNVISFFIKRLKDKGLETSLPSFKKIMFILIGSFGGDLISTQFEKYLSYESIGTFDIENLSRDLSLKNTLNFNNLIIVPFLPLKITALEKCVLKELNSIIRNEDNCVVHPTIMLNNFLLKREITVKNIVESVRNVSINSKEKLSILPYGCKGVRQHVSLLIF